LTVGNDGQDPLAALMETPRIPARDDGLRRVALRRNRVPPAPRRRRLLGDHAFSNADGTNPRSEFTLTIGGLLYGTGCSGAQAERGRCIA
jgi:hypothetical protein